VSRGELETLAGALLATAIAVIAALLLAHWAACEAAMC
jgi:ABC-type phosphate/phosphonate transport system permease subunit